MPVFPHSTSGDLLNAVLEELPVGAQIPPRLFPVVVPSLPFGDWLQLRIAERRGICMGIDFLMPQDFIRCVPVPLAPSRDSAWTKRRLLWQMLPLVAGATSHLGLNQSSTRDRFAVANLLADQFDQYGHFRPQMIRRWAEHKSCLPLEASAEDRMQESWQRNLWDQLQVSISEVHPAIELLRVRHDTSTLNTLRDAFPRLLVLGTGALDPLLIEVISVLQLAGCDVSTHILLPSLGYLGELRQMPPPELTQDPESLELRSGHPLVQSMGRHAVGSFLLLGELDEQYTHWPEVDATPPDESSILRHIQSDIRSLRPPGSHPHPPDHSLRVHKCFGPRREMETLRDEILRAFIEIEGLQPDEIHIVTPHLETYAPYISAVLQQGGYPLPVRITEIAPGEREPIAEFILALLQLAADGAFTASGLMEITSLRAVQAALDIIDDPDGHARVNGWIRDTGITRGLGESGTWTFGRDRLIAGHWFGASRAAMYPDGSFVLPVAGALDGSPELNECWICWHAELESTLQEWLTPTSPTQWGERIGHVCDVLLTGQDDDPRMAMQDVIQFLATVEVTETLDAASISDWMEVQLNERGQRTMVSGKITMGRFKQLQNLPCRVLAMVGMEEGEFPSRNRAPSWDLLRMDPRVWDRSPRIDDRQIFLDAILTPTDRLIITASNHSVRNGKEGPLSPCVEELLRVAHGMGVPTADLVVNQRLQPFAQGYFDGLSTLPPSFDTENAATAITFLSPIKDDGIPFYEHESTASAGIEGPQEISLGDLIGFWVDPAKGFLQAQGITIARDEVDSRSLDRSPLLLGGRESWQVKQAILTETVEGDEDLDEVRDQMRANRQLPRGSLGTAVWTSQRALSEPTGRAARRLMGPRISAEVRLSDPALCITGSFLCSTQESHLLVYRAGKLDQPGHLLRAWISACFAAAAGHPLPVWILDDENADEPRERQAIESPTAMNLLRDLVAGYIQGRCCPLAYAPATSAECAKQLMKTGDEAKAIAASLTAWTKDGSYGGVAGDGLKAAAQLAWRDVDPFADSAAWLHWARAIAVPLQQWSQE